MDKIISIYFLQKVFNNISKKPYLKIAKYNKNLQNKLNLSIDTYIKYSQQIEIEIIPYLKGLKKNQFKMNLYI